MEEIELSQLEESLKADPNIQEALAAHNAACEEDSDNCVVCNTRKAIGALIFVSQALEHVEYCDDPECEEITELDIASSMIDSLESALQLISASQTAIKFLSELSQAAAFIIHTEEIDEDGDEE